MRTYLEIRQSFNLLISFINTSYTNGWGGGIIITNISEKEVEKGGIGEEKMELDDVEWINLFWLLRSIVTRIVTLSAICKL